MNFLAVHDENLSLHFTSVHSLRTILHVIPQLALLCFDCQSFVSARLFFLFFFLFFLLAFCHFVFFVRQEITAPLWSLLCSHRYSTPSHKQSAWHTPLHLKREEVTGEVEKKKKKKKKTKKYWREREGSNSSQKFPRVFPKNGCVHSWATTANSIHNWNAPGRPSDARCAGAGDWKGLGTRLCYSHRMTLSDGWWSSNQAGFSLRSFWGSRETWGRKIAIDSWVHRHRSSCRCATIALHADVPPSLFMQMCHNSVLILFVTSQEAAQENWAMRNWDPVGGRRQRKIALALFSHRTEWLLHERLRSKLWSRQPLNIVCWFFQRDFAKEEKEGEKEWTFADHFGFRGKNNSS